MDARMNRPRNPVHVSDDHVLRLRNAPILGQVDLFPPELLKQIQQERDAEGDKEFNRVIKAKVAMASPSMPFLSPQPQYQPRAPKRKASTPATVSVPPERQPKQRRQAAPQQQQGQRASYPAQAQPPRQQQHQFPSGGAGPAASNR